MAVGFVGDGSLVFELVDPGQAAAAQSEKEVGEPELDAPFGAVAPPGHSAGGFMVGRRPGTVGDWAGALVGDEVPDEPEAVVGGGVVAGPGSVAGGGVVAGDVAVLGGVGSLLGRPLAPADAMCTHHVIRTKPAKTSATRSRCPRRAGSSSPKSTDDFT
jgi:hypothetical protein